MPSERARDLQNNCALVTGAAKRIGASIASALHEAGADIAIHFRGSEQAALELRNALNARRDGSAEIFGADLADQEQLVSLVQRVNEWSGRLDILINNASRFYPTPIGTITLTHWDDLIDSNFKAPLFLSQAAVPLLTESSGCIVNIIDIHAKRPLRDHAVYGSAKAGLAMLTRSLAKDLAPAVRVNGVAPGAILWPDNDMNDDNKEAILQQIPMGRAGEARDIADAVLYLVRDANYVTGQIIAVDGGRSLAW